MTIALDAYKAGLNSAAYFLLPQSGFLRVADRDRAAFLQRQTTNDLRHVKFDRSVTTILTSSTARILDVFCVIDEGESLGVVTLPGRLDHTLNFLQRRIFFSDQVALNDNSENFVQIILFGPHMNDVLERLGLQSPGSDHIIQGEIANQPIRVISQRILAAGCCLLVPTADLDGIFEALNEAGATSVNPETFDILRVEAGRPGPVGELVEDYTPLEVGLQELISDKKGCYTGQEIIARQITYDKVSKSLVGVKLDTRVGDGAQIKVEDKSAGKLTSLAESPRFGIVGLAVVRKPYDEVGTGISVSTDDSIARGKIAALPFE